MQHQLNLPFGEAETNWNEYVIGGANGEEQSFQDWLRFLEEAVGCWDSTEL